jgi:hypothetical protein
VGLESSAKIFLGHVEGQVSNIDVHTRLL